MSNSPPPLLGSKGACACHMPQTDYGASKCISLSFVPCQPIPSLSLFFESLISKPPCQPPHLTPPASLPIPASFIFPRVAHRHLDTPLPPFLSPLPIFLPFHHSISSCLVTQLLSLAPAADAFLCSSHHKQPELQTPPHPSQLGPGLAPTHKVQSSWPLPVGVPQQPAAACSTSVGTTYQPPLEPEFKRGPPSMCLIS